MSYNLLLFSFTIIVISLIPGLNVMLVVSQSIQGGLKESTTSIMGIVVGNVIYFAVSILGLGAFLIKFPEAFNVIKFAGVAFTIYSAWSLLKLGFAKQTDQIDFIRSGKSGKTFVQGMLTIISNPKAFIFWITVLPGFVDRQQNILVQVGNFWYGCHHNRHNDFTCIWLPGKFCFTFYSKEVPECTIRGFRSNFASGSGVADLFLA